MNLLSIKGERRLYLTKDERLPEKLFLEQKEYPIPKVSDELYDWLIKSNDFRIIISFQTWRNDTYLECLYWFDKTDLDALDRKVVAGLAKPDDFKFSMATHFNVTFCRRCLDRWRSLAGRSYGFIDDFDDEAVLPHLVRYCPNCGTSFGGYPVFKLFYQVEDDELYKQYRELVKQQREQHQNDGDDV